MDLFISNLDSRTTKEQLKHIMIPVLQRFHIETFDLRKRNDKTFAFLAIADIVKAQKLLAYAAQTESLLKSPSGRYAKFGVSNRPTDPQLFRVLQKEEKDLKSRQTWQKMTQQNLHKVTVAEDGQILAVRFIECGRWKVMSGGFAFDSHWIAPCEGSLERDGRALKLQLKLRPSQKHFVLLDLWSIQSLSVSTVKGSDTLTITLSVAPKFFEEENADPANAFADMLQALSVGTNYRSASTRYRVGGLPGTTPAMIGSCLSYRITFQSQPQVNFRNIIQKLTSHQISVTRIQGLTDNVKVLPFPNEIAQLKFTIHQYACSFGWRFQIQALWANGLLSPSELKVMMPAMAKLRKQAGEPVLINVLKRLALHLTIPDASTKSESSGIEGALKAMKQQEDYLLDNDLDEEETSMRDEVSIHKATVTPTGIYLSGPEAIAANRILRKYRARQDCFLRVVFADENGEKLEYDRDFSNDKVLKGRFLGILRKGLDIAGEHFDFLGFSHSSLRSQACWFMRAFIHEGSLLYARQLIQQLGDFSAIRCPAKCAARIGQAFSETTGAVHVDPKIVKTFPDIRVGEYMFTDGCGTISKESWRALKSSSSSKNQPTSYQIRYKGKHYSLARF